MAIGFVKTVVIGRTTGGNAVKVAAYCSGSMLVAESVSITYDFTEKTDVDCSIILTPLVVEPSCWLMDRQQLWNKVEASEIRYDAQVCREVMIAIPRELDRQDKIDLTISHVRSSYVDRGMVADICFHDLESHNPHAHVMLTMRDLLIDPEGNIDFGNKNRSWNEKKLLKTQRLEWDELANSYLERAGIPDRIDTRSYQERGIENRLPQIHLGPAVCRMRAKGIPTARGDMYDRIEAANAVIAQQLEKIYNLNQDLANLEREIADLQSESELSIEDDTTSKNIPPSEASIQSAEESIDSPADTLENLPERIDLARGNRRER
jgi:hypothetical protein